MVVIDCYNWPLLAVNSLILPIRKFLRIMMMEAIPLEELERMEKLIHILEIVFTIFKYLPLIIGVLAGISLILAAFNFMEKSYGWAIVNLVLGISGMLFVIRLNMRQPKHFNEPAELAHENT